MNYLKNPLLLYGVIILLFLANIGELLYIFKEKCECPVCEKEEIVPVVTEEQEVEKNKEHIMVDIKGYVKKPGVYELESGAIVNDLIKLAGGLKSGATTENINLSKKLIDEATVVVSSKTELKKQNTYSSSNAINNHAIQNYAAIEQTPKENTSSTQNTNIQGKISINTATKEELMTLNGVGEKTAEKIIEYRNTQPFNSIEEIKNVSGIGDSVFEKIKDNITV